MSEKWYARLQEMLKAELDHTFVYTPDKMRGQVRCNGEPVVTATRWSVRYRFVEFIVVDDEGRPVLAPGGGFLHSAVFGNVEFDSFTSEKYELDRMLFEDE